MTAHPDSTLSNLLCGLESKLGKKVLEVSPTTRKLSGQHVSNDAVIGDFRRYAERRYLLMGARSVHYYFRFGVCRRVEAPQKKQGSASDASFRIRGKRLAIR
jgi:hypothetical protein